MKGLSGFSVIEIKYYLRVKNNDTKKKNEQKN